MDCVSGLSYLGSCVGLCLYTNNLSLRRNGIPEDGVRLIHFLNEQLYLNFSTRTFIGYADVSHQTSEDIGTVMDS